MAKIKQNKFHGMIVVSDQDNVTVKGKDVIEINSSGDIVCRYYDFDGNAEDNPMVLDILNFCASKLPKKVTEQNITGYIKKTVGKNSLLISENAISRIQIYLK